MPRRRAVTKQDRNHKEVIAALRDRCGGYWKDKGLPHHYAYIQGLRVCAYDTHGVGNGFPDWEIWVSWLCMGFEVKQERPQTKHVDAIPDEQHYKAQLEDSEVFYRLHHSSLVPIVWDREQVYAWIQAMAAFVLYVEDKAEGSRELLDLFFPSAAKEAKE